MILTIKEDRAVCPGSPAMGRRPQTRGAPDACRIGTLALATTVLLLIAAATGCRRDMPSSPTTHRVREMTPGANLAYGEEGPDRRNLAPPPDWLRIGVADARNRVRSRPGDPGARRDLGLALYADGQYEEAAREITAFIGLQPGVPQAHYYLGQCYMALRRPKEASVAFRAAIRLDPEAARDAEIVCDLAQAHMEAGELDEAQRWFSDARKLDPGMFWPAFGLGSIAAQQRNGRDARRFFELSIGLAASRKSRALAHASLGKLSLESGDALGARASFDAALRLDPGCVRALHGLQRLNAESPQ